MYKTVHCEKKFKIDAEQIWSLLKDFSNEWHPMVNYMSFERGPNGALIRKFTTIGDESSYEEQLTYISHSDREMRYVLIKGIKGIEFYRASVSVRSIGKNSVVSWRANISGEDSRLDEICSGTKEIFMQGLGALEDLQPVMDKEYLVNEDKLDFEDRQISDKPKLAISVYPYGVMQSNIICIFLHGIGGNRSNWVSQIKMLGKVLPCVSLDLRGYGDSEFGSKQSTIDFYCEDILSVMEVFKAEKVILCGLSYGSWIATSFAMRHSNALDGLILTGGCTGMSEADSIERESFRKSREVPLDLGKRLKDFAPDVVNILAGPNLSKFNRDLLIQSMSQISTKTYRDALICFTNPPEKLDFSKIKCPVLLMTGEYDILAPPNEIREVSNRIYNQNIEPDIQFEVLSDSGHVCNLEASSDYNNFMIKFVTRILKNDNNVKYSPKSQRRKEKQQRILEAALKEFSMNGFSGASMETIAKRSNVSKPTLYQYFGNKKNLLSAVLNLGTYEILAPLRSSSQESLAQTLWNFSWSYAKFVLRADTLSLARLIIGEAERNPVVSREYQEAGPLKALSGIFEYLRIQKNKRSIDYDDIELAAQSLWNLILSGPREFHLHNPNEEMEIKTISKYIYHGLKVFLSYYSLNTDSDIKELEKLFVNLKQSDVG